MFAEPILSLPIGQWHERWPWHECCDSERGRMDGGGCLVASVVRPFAQLQVTPFSALLKFPAE
jgi:hypothetical protein